MYIMDIIISDFDSEKHMNKHVIYSVYGRDQHHHNHNSAVV